ncbi:MAG: TolC family protein [Candidatus Omnitrophota bacterium]|jgi:outer membrane protein TolC
MTKLTTFALIILYIFCAAPAVSRAEETLTWQDCVREAAKNHPDLISAEQSVKQSAADRDIAMSGLFPQVDASAGASRTKTTRTTDSYTYGLSGSQLLYDGLKTLDNVNAALENINAALFTYRFTSSGIRLRLRTAFINLLKAQELLRITEEIAKIRRDNLVLITLRYESGIEHKGALLTAEANLSQAEYEIAQNKRNLDAVQRQIIKEMGRKEFSPVSVEGDFQVSDEALEKPDFEEIARENPSLERSISQKKSAEFGIKSAEADFRPVVSVQAGADRTSSHWPPENDQWNTGLTVSFPIFEGGLRKAQVSRAKAVFDKAQADERSVRDGIVLALEQSWAALRNSVETVKVQKKFLDASEERSEIAEAQYSLGLIQFDNWTIIEDDLVRQKKAFLDARANALSAEANWIQAKGETLEYAE